MKRIRRQDYHYLMEGKITPGKWYIVIDEVGPKYLIKNDQYKDDAVSKKHYECQRIHRIKPINPRAHVVLNARLTIGKIYTMDGKSIIDDQGKPLKPSINCEKNWEINPIYLEDKTITDRCKSTPEMQLLLYGRYPYLLLPDLKEIPTKSTTKQETTMKIETNVTLIDGNNAESFSVDSLISAIGSEQGKIDSIDKTSLTEANKIALVKPHQNHIKQLNKILASKV